MPRTPLLRPGSGRTLRSRRPRPAGPAPRRPSRDPYVDRVRWGGGLLS